MQKSEKTIATEHTLRKDPKNPLDIYRKDVDFDHHFMELFFN